MLFFFLGVLLPPRSTLFPYTTLFRSRGFRIADGGVLYLIEHDGRHIRTQFRLASDRKSTRLNSSHSSISYAVFCLKKKTRLIPSPSPVFITPNARRESSLHLSYLSQS